MELGVIISLNERLDLNYSALIRVLKDLGYDGAITVEREISGEQQIADILKAKYLLENLIREC